MLDVLTVAGLILFPIAASILAVSFALHKNISCSSLNRTISLHSSDGLASQGLFWLSIAIPFFLFCEFGYFVWSGHELTLSQKGFQYFVTISALPIGLLSLSIPAAALVTKLHSTAQTAKQIVIAEKKNNYDLFYMHRREFAAFYAQIGSQDFLGDFTTSYKINPRLHARIFRGDAANGIPMLRDDFIGERISDILLARELLSKTLNSNTLKSALQNYIKYCNITNDFMTHFGMQEVQLQLAKKSTTIEYTVNGEIKSQRTTGVTTRQAVASFRCSKSYLMLAIEFAGYEEGIQAIRSAEIDYIDSTTGYQTINHQQVRVIETLLDRFKSQSPLNQSQVPDLTETSDTDH